MNKWSHESALTMGTALWSVRQTRSAPFMVCGITGKEIDLTRPWSLFCGYDPVHPSAEGEAPELLQVAVAELNQRGIRDDDELQVGLTLPVYFQSQYCPMEKAQATLVSRRDIDAAVGLRQGERCHGLSLAALHRMSPTLERYLSERFGTPIYEPPAPPQPSAEETATIERNALKYSIATIAARSLFGKVPSAAEVGRTIEFIEAIKAYCNA